jgi:hypothetical protein
MSFFEDASLVLIPSGIKNQKIYSVKPTDGTGDLTFSRASSATRVASNGLIEKVRTNLNANGNLVGLALNTNPTGYTSFNTGTFEPVTNTTSAVGNFCKFTTSETRSFLVYSATIVSGQTYAFSYKVQALGQSTDNQDAHTIVSGASSYVTYINGVAAPTGSTPIAIGTITIVFTASSTSLSIRFGLGVSSNKTGTLELGNIQLETGDIATDYIATTTAAVSVGPVSGLPRLDYLNSSCPRLLLEGQRTNVITFSENFDNAGWTKTNVTLTSTLGGPIDQSKYFTITCNGTAGTFKGVGKTFFNTSPNTYSLSVFAKAGNSSTFVVSSRATLTTNDVRAIFNLSNGTITSTNGGTAAIVPYGDGWYRCSFTVVNAGTFTDQSSIFFGHPFGAADGATVLATGAMSEIGAYATSYIPTLSTSVTRVADVASASYTGLTTTSGSLFFDLKEGFAGQNINSGVASLGLRLASTGTNDSVGVRDATLGTFQGVIRIGGSSTNLGSTFSGSAATKVCFVWTASTIKMFKDGALFDSASISTPAVFNTLELPNISRTVIAPLAQALIFPTALTDAQAIELTA